MRHDIRFLQELEDDLLTVTRTRTSGATKRHRRRTWRGVAAGGAAAVIAASFAIGVLMQGTDGMRAASAPGVASGGGATAASDVGYTVDRPGDTAPRAGALSAPTIGVVDEAAPQPTTAPQATAGETTDLSKIIRTGDISLTIATDSFPQRAAEVVAIAQRNGGSVLSSTTAGGTSGTFTLRIPSSRFDRAMVELAGLGSVDASSVQGQDVTAEYIDQRAHLKIYLAHRRFLYGLLAEATTTGQVVALENQLQQVQLKIDQVTGQLRYLDNQVSMSTIHVDLHEPGSEPISTVENPSLGDAFSRAVRGLLSVLSLVMVGLGYLLPVLVIGGIAYLVVRLVRRRGSAAL